MAKSGYVLAGFETLTAILNNFIKDTKGRYQNNFTRKDISVFLSKTCSGFLHSYGQNFPKKKKYDKHNSQEATLYKKCRETGFYDDSPLIIDSGGFQISIGKLDRRESEILIKLYYEFLKEYHHVLDKAFILDVPPGPGCEVFETFQDVYDLNLESYLLAKDLPDDCKKKIIYIHHFRTPQLWKIYTKIMRENELFNEFQYHGTGGIVANMRGDTAIPCIIYILPLVPLLNEAKKYGKDILNFHLLGGANFRDVLFYKLFSHHVEQTHGIKLNITYDSSGLFKGLMIGRYMQIEDDQEVFRKVDLRSSNINNRFFGKFSVRDALEYCFNKTARKYGFKEIILDEIYNDVEDTFFEEVKVYAMLYMLDQFTIVEEIANKTVDMIYPMYLNGNLEEFITTLTETTRKLNNGKLTRKQKAKAYSLPKSLDMLTNLDEDFCEHIVNKFLSKDEFINLDQKKRMLQI